MDRVPIDTGDGPFYASIARSVQLRGIGVPSVLRDTPTAVDHVRFYGPVFFRLTAGAFRWFGFSSLVYRAIGVAGAVLVATGGLAMCHALGGGPDRRTWAFVLLLFSPELGSAATFGRMDPLAVGLEMLGLAVFLHGLVRERSPSLHGLGAGMLLSAAGLTTPRTFPFLFGFLIAALTILPTAAPEGRRVAWRQLTATMVTVIAVYGAWIVLSSATPLRWLRMMTFIATHENTDVALLRSVRDAQFVWWQAITLAFSVIGALLAAFKLRGQASYVIAASFALTACWTTLVTTMTLFNYTFMFGTYFVLPLFAVVIAVPTPLSHRHRRAAGLLAVALFMLLGGVRVGKWVRSAVTWTARSPTRLEAFVRTNVPAGSAVMGPHEDYFFVVEEAGSRYLSAEQVSTADWARWMPQIEGTSWRSVSTEAGEIGALYLLWPADRVRYGVPPPNVSCAVERAIAVYEPPPYDIPLLAAWVKDDPRAMYPETVLYALKPRCDHAQTGGAFR